MKRVAKNRFIMSIYNNGFLVVKINAYFLCFCGLEWECGIRHLALCVFAGFNAYGFNSNLYWA